MIKKTLAEKFSLHDNKVNKYSQIITAVVNPQYFKVKSQNSRVKFS